MNKRFTLANNLQEIGAALGAGTNCGSCLPELEALLREGTYERAA